MSIYKVKQFLISMKLKITTDCKKIDKKYIIMYNKSMKNDFLPKNTAIMSNEDARALNPLVLSFVGDSVQTLFVRVKFASTITSKAHSLHLRTANEINAKSQALAMAKIENKLNDDEMNIYKRARNSKSSTIPKNASAQDYKVASGFEALIGYLYLTGQDNRLNELINSAYNND